jgi:hypothetical protein
MNLKSPSRGCGTGALLSREILFSETPRSPTSALRGAGAGGFASKQGKRTVRQRLLCTLVIQSLPCTGSTAAVVAGILFGFDVESNFGREVDCCRRQVVPLPRKRICLAGDSRLRVRILQVWKAANRHGDGEGDGCASEKPYLSEDTAFFSTPSGYQWCWLTPKHYLSVRSLLESSELH